MSLAMPERLYRLLPAVHRLRDAGQGEPLRALLAVIEVELERIEADVAGLYDNWFIETCDEWVVPYIGDLLGVRPMRPVPSAGVSARAYVANTIAYRRRKGTAVVLEQLARDVTGWPARAVEYFQRLATTQHMNHVRPASHFTAGVRDAARAEGAAQAGGAFDPFTHNAELRHIATRGGRHNIPHVGLFLWRLRSHTIGAGSPGDEAADFISARALGGWWSVHPAGLDTPLFNRARTETTITHLAAEDNVPGPLRRLALHAELERLRTGVADPPPRFMTGDDPVLRLFVRLQGEVVPVEVAREDIHLCALPDEVVLASPPARAVALDPARGRLGFPGGLAVQEVWVQASFGAAGDLGGGPYDRSAALRRADAAAGSAIDAAGRGGFDDPSVWQVGVSHLHADDGSGTLFGSLRDAVAAWHAQPPGTTGVIVLMDSLSEVDTMPLEVAVGERSRLLVVAGGWPLEAIPGAPPGSVARLPGHVQPRGVRAHRIGDLVVRGSAPAGSADPGACVIQGLMLEGRLGVGAGHLGSLALSHSTLLPGFGGLVVEGAGNERLRLGIAHSICAAIAVDAAVDAVVVEDSLVGDEGGSPAVSLAVPQAAASLRRCTFFGAVAVQGIEASDCLFAGGLVAERQQSGCVRYSHVPPGSRSPRRYRCQPELELAMQLEARRRRAPPPTAAEEDALRAEVEARIRPLFVSRRVGDPGFGQLARRCPLPIRTGAESGAEMGAYEFLKQPQREANLRDALDEYLRFGLEAGTFFVT
jgi:hypothetical protein